ncbi:non-ribosomal peptide synthetase [Agrobacterium vitis]
MTIHDRAATAASIAKTGFNDGHAWPLSSQQSRIWLLSQAGHEAVYGRQSIGFRFVSVGIDRAHAGIEALMRRHPLLNRCFEVRAGGIVYQLLGQKPLPVVECELARDEDLETALKQASAAYSARVLDLEMDAAGQLTLFTARGRAVGMLLSLHPLIGDRAALDRLAVDFLDGLDRQADLGRENLAGEEAGLIEASHWLAQGAAMPQTSDAYADFWFNRLAAQETVAMLPTQAPAAGVTSSGQQAWREKVVEVAWSASASMADVTHDSLAALAIVLRRYSGCGAQRIGLVTRQADCPVATRTEDLLLVTSEIDGRLALSAVRERLAEGVATALSHRLSFEALTNALARRDDGFEVASLVATVLDVRPALQLEAQVLAGELATVLVEPPARRDAGLVVTVSGLGTEALAIRLGYDPQSHSDAMIDRFARDLRLAFEALRRQPEQLVSSIAFMSAEELDHLSAPYPDQPEDDDGTPIHQVISAQAQRRPEAFAVAQGDTAITHGALEAAANRLAHRLVAMGIGPEDRVAVALNKSIDAIIAILAVLKAGGAFTPVEPDHPEARNRHILSAPGLALVISRSRYITDLPRDIGTPILNLDKLDLSSESTEPPVIAIAPAQLAYVIYTSGSTGIPKGVAVEHGPLAHHCKATLRIYEMDETSCEYPVLPFTSDGGHERWMVPLMAGGGVVLTADKLATPEDAFALMRRHGVNNASLPTSYIRGLAEYAAEKGGIPQLRLYSFGGEALSQAVFDLLTDNLKAQMLINGYGPTETIMTPMVWKIPAGTRFEGTVAPIGRGVGDRRIYVLDSDLVPVPVGVIGEIHIGGSGIARGYLGQPELTAERFIDDPFSTNGGRMYKSGDLGRWREDGTVEFAGRVDHQIKLRGYRIEPGEIEAVLRADPNVSEAVVLLHQDSGRSALIAYVVARDDEDVNVNDLRRAAVTALPDYMVPQHIMVLDALPMGPNSKLDRSALPLPKLQRDIVPPANDKEAAILEVWKQILDIKELSVTENFFDVGGQSLAAVRIVSRLKMQHPKWPLTIADMFNYPTVRDLALAMDENRQEDKVGAIYLRRDGDRPVLYCFPGLLVSTREYMRLVDYLGPNQPATGFVCYSLTETPALSTRVEDITARYAEAVRSQAKGRPCAFLGWSWGGLLAYEAAQQLGNDVDLRMIGMVDVCDMGDEFAIGVWPHFEPGVRERTHDAVQRWLKVAPMREAWLTLMAAMDAEVYEQFLHHIVKHNVPLPVDGPDIGSEEHIFWVLLDNAMIFRNYQLKTSQFRIHAFSAEDSVTRGLSVIEWRRYSPNATACELVTGTNHLSIIGKSRFHQRFAQRLDLAIQGKS